MKRCRDTEPDPDPKCVCSLIRNQLSSIRICYKCGICYNYGGIPHFFCRTKEKKEKKEEEEFYEVEEEMSRLYASLPPNIFPTPPVSPPWLVQEMDETLAEMKAAGLTFSPMTPPWIVLEMEEWAAQFEAAGLFWL